MDTITQQKKEIRKQKTALRRGLDGETARRWSEEICRRILASEVYQRAETIFVYNAVPGEVSLKLLIEEAGRDGKRVAYPLCVSKTQMEAYVPSSEGDFAAGAYGIREPDPERSERIAPEEIDLVLAPCTAFDEACGRLGMGGGYYDRYLQRCTGAYLAAVAFEVQKCERVPMDEFDCRMDAVFTQEGSYQRI